MKILLIEDEPKTVQSLKQGLEKTYSWIYDEIVSGANIKKFARK